MRWELRFWIVLRTAKADVARNGLLLFDKNGRRVG